MVAAHGGALGDRLTVGPAVRVERVEDDQFGSVGVRGGHDGLADSRHQGYLQVVGDVHAVVEHVGALRGADGARRVGEVCGNDLDPLVLELRRAIDEPDRQAGVGEPSRHRGTRGSSAEHDMKLVIGG